MRKIFLLFIPIVCLASQSPSWPMEWRKKALLRLDQLGNQAIPFSSRAFITQESPVAFSFTQDPSPLDPFIAAHGFFSCWDPLVGVVTESVEDVRAVEHAMGALKGMDPAIAELATAELLAKALAYRVLEQGLRISIPVVLKGKIQPVEYEVDAVLDLWSQMPAFGLVPRSSSQAPPILLFRGTDLSLLSKRSWASVISDLDTSGVGLSAFQNGRGEIHRWLVKAAALYSKSRVLGFSLGGSLALYTVLFEGELIADRGSIAFNPPGVSQEIFDLWQQIRPKKLLVYTTQGDLVSKLGKLVPPTFVFGTKMHLGPIAAHTQIMTAEHSVHADPIDIEQENLHRLAVE